MIKNRWRTPNLFGNGGGIVKIGSITLIFYIFEYGAKFGAECSAKSGTKQFFIEEERGINKMIKSTILKNSYFKI